jgi:hypothetical protein
MDYFYIKGSSFFWMKESRLDQREGDGEAKGKGDGEGEGEGEIIFELLRI